MIAYVTPIIDSASDKRGRGMMKTSRNNHMKLCNIAVLIVFASVMLVASITPAMAIADTTPTPTPTLTCTWGNICVNETGWWRDGGVLNGSGTPIQAAIGNATAGETIIVRDGTYNENVDVTVQLTIRSENGSAHCNVIAINPNDHVFDVQVDYVNISGFNVSGATGSSSSSLGVGIHLFRSQHCNISNNTASNNFIGIYLNCSSNNTLTSNTASTNTGMGIGLYSSSNNTLSINTASTNSQYGIGLYSSSNNTLSINTASTNSWYGIYLNSSSNNTLTGNTASTNGGGIVLESLSNYNTLTSNTASTNSWYGIYLDSSSNNTLSSNTASTNSRYGIYLDSSSNNTLTSNTASTNSWYGIYLDSSSNNTLSSNTASTNILWDFYIMDSSSTFTDNTLNGATVSFTYNGSVSLKGEGSPAAAPSGQHSIGKFINATNQSADAWLCLNFSYSNADVSGLDESSLTVWKYNGTTWLEDSWNGTRYLTTTNNVVGVNITTFSVFAPMALALPTPPSSSSSGGIGTSDEPENVEDTVVLRIYLQAGESSNYNFNDVVTSVDVTPEKTYGLVAAKIEVLHGQPGSITTDPPAGKIYKYVNVYVGTSGWSEDKFSSSVINFQIPASWFEENNIDPASVTLHRHNNGEWKSLATTLTGQAGGHYQYSSPTPGFSTFMILGQVEGSSDGEPAAVTDTGTVTEATSTPETTSDKGIPGFGILAGIVAVMMVVYLRKK